MRPYRVLGLVVLIVVMGAGAAHGQGYGPAASFGERNVSPKPTAVASSPAAVAQPTPSTPHEAACPRSNAACAYDPAGSVTQSPYGASPTLYPPVVPRASTAPAAYGAPGSPRTAPKALRLGLLLGYGVGFDDLEPWKLGLGATFGFDLGQLHLGARFAYHFGKSDVDEYSARSIELWELGAIIGYDFAVSDSFSVRPYVSPGLATLITSYEDSQASGTNSEVELALAGGVTALYDVGSVFFVGADVKIQHIFSYGITGAIFMATGGARL